MPSPTTALDLIRGGLGLTNAVGVDQTLTASEVSDCLAVFNDILEDWSTQQLAVYGQANQTFNTIANQAVYTIGSGGNWNTVRPERIHEPGYTTYQGTNQPLVMMNQAQYNLIDLKTQTQEFANFYLYVNEYPLGLVTLWPVPSMVLPVTLSIDRVLSQVASAATSISFPQGYAKAFKYTLGVELAPLFGKKMANFPDIAEIQKTTFANIKRANVRPVILGYDVAITGNRYIDWRTG